MTMKILMAALVVALPSVCLSFVTPQAVTIRRRVKCRGSTAVLATQPKYGVMEVGKYAVATGVQFGFLVGALRLVDPWFPAFGVGPLFAFLSLRSRIFSLLDNSRPDVDSQGGKATPSDVKRPWWTPPGIAFPFIWLTITILRAVSASFVYQGSLISLPLLALLFHLCVGDTWNTITNVEKRLGVSAVGCYFVLFSVFNAVRLFDTVDRVAATILAPSLLWISIATVLTTNIWLINTPKNRPLWPSPDDGQSAKIRFAYLFSSNFNPTPSAASELLTRLLLPVVVEERVEARRRRRDATTLMNEHSIII